MAKKVFLAALLLSPVIVCAQSSENLARQAISARTVESPTSMTSDQQTQLVKKAEELAQDSWKIAAAIDRGQMGLVWDRASSVAKLSRRQAFTQQIFTDRGKLGAPSSRKQVAITFAQSEGGAVPAGLYINISYATQFARKGRPIRELISYHLDEDHIWRVSGYSVR